MVRSEIEDGMNCWCCIVLLPRADGGSSSSGDEDNEGGTSTTTGKSGGASNTANEKNGPRYLAQLTKGHERRGLTKAERLATKRAKIILEDTGAQDVSSAGESSADYAKSDKPMHRMASDR